MATLKAYVAPVPLDGRDGHHVTGEERDASAIVADAGLLREVLRRAALICPDELEAAARTGRKRLAEIAAGEYFHTCGTKPP